MASKTKRTELKRTRRNARMGSKRKADNRNNGTTKSAAVLFGDEK